MKRLMLTTAVLTAISLPALAQDGVFRNEMTAGSVHASDLIGARIYATETALDADKYAGVQEGWNDIGEVNDLVVARDGKVEAVLVDIGGFLGMGERQVAVDMTALRFVSDGATADNPDDWFLVMNADRPTLETAPEWSMSAVNTATDAAAGTEVAAEGATTTMTEGEAATPVARTDGMMRDGYSAVVSTELTADVLQGAPAYDANEANVGDVGDLILASDGSVEGIIIDVGGFLGMGAKPVQLTLDQVNILRQNDGADVRVYVALTKEELEALPTHEM
jgi:hypothetical protein